MKPCFHCETPTSTSLQTRGFKRRVYICLAGPCWKAYYALHPDVPPAKPERKK